jgi:Tol biopolymer transport system component
MLVNKPLVIAGVCLASATFSLRAAAQSTDRVSVASGGIQANAESDGASVSADGRLIAFSSTASNLVAGDTNATEDVFVRDRLLGTTKRVSISSAGAQANGASREPSISPNGRFVVFESSASNLVPNDTNGTIDVFRYDRTLGQIHRFSLAFDGAEPDASCRHPRISAASDGRFVSFESAATNLVAGDANGVVDVFVRDSLLAVTERVSVSTGGTEGDLESHVGSLSADGRQIAFESSATNLVAGDGNGFRDVFVRDRVAATTERVSIATNGAEADADSLRASISGDGNTIAFDGAATNLVPGDTNGLTDVFAHDRLLGTTGRVSVGPGGVQGNGDSVRPVLSADGRQVAFGSQASTLVAGDANGTGDVFLHDRSNGATELASVSTGGTQANASSGPSASISADGSFVAFGSVASDLVPADTNGLRDCFVHDRGIAHPVTPFCFGDGSTLTACPCGNLGGTGLGCDNSSGNGGGLLSGTGTTRPDTIVITAAQMPLNSSLHVYLQGDQLQLDGAVFGDGLLCLSGQILRLAVRSGASSQFPGAGSLSITARSAELGSPIAPGDVRWYQTWYRDAAFGWCPPGVWNITNGLRIDW